MILPHHSVDWKGKIIGKKELEHRRLRRVSHLEMGKPSFASLNDEHDQDAAPKSFFNKHHQQKVSMLPLVFLIFYQVAGGPFGIEDSVKAGGPLLALLGFLLFPFIWSIPEAFITAEMVTMFPENGGYVVWISAAFGPFWGFQQGWWKWFSGVIDNALYPILFLDYLKSAVPAVAGGPVRIIVIIVITAFLTYLNYRGLTIIGWAAVGVGVFSLMPFCVMTILAIPRLQPSNWFILDMGSIDWNTYLNTLFWNLNYWDSISTLAGEVDDPQRTLPKALFFAFLLAVGSYFFPLLSGIGSIEFVRSSWSDGYFADVATVVGGRWLRLWMTAAAALSQMGMFEAEMSSDSFQLLGMAERGMLPQIFATRSVYGTPTVGILASASGVLLLSWMSFQEIIAAENFLYCFSMFLEFSAFIWLRKNKPEITRPYRIPLGMVGIVMMCIPPSMLLVLVMTFATWKVTLVSLTLTLIGCALYPFLVFTKRKKWFQFTVSTELPMLPTKEISDKSSDKDSSDTELELLSG